MILRPFARPMLAAWYVGQGVDAVRHPGEHAAGARAGADLLSSTVEQVPRLTDKQLTLLVRAHGGATVVAGLLLALGKAPRTSALALAALTVPLAVVDQPFTSAKGRGSGSEPGGPSRSERTSRFLRDLGGIGAALIAAADTEGRPGVQWRVARARKDLQLSQHLRDAGRSVERSVEDAAHGTGRRTRRAVKDARRTARLETYAAKERARAAKDTARHAARKARKAVPAVH
ncbi:DoxX family membrane protein [Cellulomonas sp. PhB143]|uniref:DoxX family membrane protein n=1 Tax=Cellulomonas sp. PhB143 TaxID=2485186 RepID=UPI000F4A652B|nr:DoxX family membrane protein [Cellulomonas sp. PhB143]ROS78501.1 putative membrane protein YphA (DoxX/SURF4 family) [Cellulomonas sp. PhB143]